VKKTVRKPYFAAWVRGLLIPSRVCNLAAPPSSVEGASRFFYSSASDCIYLYPLKDNSANTITVEDQSRPKGQLTL
jgi:hypothetical protein